MTRDRAKARELARRHLERGDAIGWFERLYVEADGDADVVPWADLAPNPNLVSWCERESLRGDGPTVGDAPRQALVIGCGLGDDAEYLAGLGFAVVAFDVAPTAIDWCRHRFDRSRVDYRAADLFDPPPGWRQAFDFVAEGYTLQVLPPRLHAEAMRRMVDTIRPGGTLLVITRGRDADGDPGLMPWPLSRDDLQQFVDLGLEEMSFEDYVDDEDPPVRRFRVAYRA